MDVHYGYVARNFNCVYHVFLWMYIMHVCGFLVRNLSVVSCVSVYFQA